MSFDNISEMNTKVFIEKQVGQFRIRLREIRQEKELTQKDIAQKLGVPTSTYANWEQGRREPSLYDIFNLIVELEIEANELFELE